MSTPPGDLPAQPSTPPTQIAGQQAAPSTSVPMGPVGPAYTPVGAQTNTLAVVSLVTGIASFVGHVVPVVGGFVVAVIAIVTGFMARNQIKQTGEKGGGMALAGIVIGIVHLVLIGFGLMGFLLLVLVLGTCNSIAAR